MQTTHLAIYFIDGGSNDFQFFSLNVHIDQVDAIQIAQQAFEGLPLAPRLDFHPLFEFEHLRKPS